MFTDRNSSGAMKDEYALSLFSWYTFTEVIRQGRYDAAYYILPFVYFEKAIRSPLLSPNDRLTFLCSAFSIFKHHYLELMKND